MSFLTKLSKSKKSKINISPYIFILPAALFYIIFRLGPIISTAILSFFRWDGIIPTSKFIGLKYYIYIIADPLFRNALLHNIMFLILAINIPVWIGFFLAVLLSEISFFRTLFRAMLFLPCIFGGVVVAYIWNWVYHPFAGLLNAVLQSIGLNFLTSAWLGNTRLALLSVFGAYNWASYGYSMMFFLAGLQNIPPELYDAATVDGVNFWQKILYITIPSLREVFTFVIVLRILTSLKQFEIPFILTSGGPYYATDMIELYTYRFIANYELGLACAGATLEAIIVSIASLLFIWRREK